MNPTRTTPQPAVPGAPVSALGSASALATLGALAKATKTGTAR